MNSLSITPETHAQAIIDFRAALKRQPAYKPVPWGPQLDVMLACGGECNCLAGQFIIATRYLKAIRLVQRNSEQEYLVRDILSHLNAVSRRVSHHALSIAAIHLEIQIPCHNGKSQLPTRLILGCGSKAATRNTYEVANLVVNRRAIKESLDAGESALFRAYKNGDKADMSWVKTIETLFTHSVRVGGVPSCDHEHLKPLLDKVVRLVDDTPESGRIPFAEIRPILAAMVAVVHGLQDKRSEFGRAVPLILAADYMATGCFVPPMTMTLRF